MSIKNSVFKGFDTLGITSPPQVKFDIDFEMVGALQEITIAPASEAQAAQRLDQLISNASILLPRWKQFQEEPEWVGTMGMVWRNSPDDRGVGVTCFKNNDSLASQLAIRAGIEVRTAIDLVNCNKLFAVCTDRLKHVAHILEGTSLCGIFNLIGASEAVQYGLFAKAEAKSHRPQYRADELILICERRENELIWMSDDSAQEIIRQIWSMNPGHTLWA